MNETVKYRVVLAACIALSAGGIVIAAFLCRPVDGVRGGAIAVGLALVTMFLGRDYGDVPIDAVRSYLSYLKKRLMGNRGQPSASDILDRLTGIESQLLEISNAIQASQAISSGSTRRQNVYLALSSGIGTAAWGFGDWASQWLVEWLARCPAG